MQPSKDRKSKPHLSLAFDVGHSSIGWAVLDSKKVDILGCGTVIFPANDCLASARRVFRRQRRHIRATRDRIARLKILLEAQGALPRAKLDRSGRAWPWLLAARVLRGGGSLNWQEMWDVLRWYAHNRGYDGNRAWAATEAEAEDEDAEKVSNARALYAKYGTQTMAETYCAVCGLDPLGEKKSCNLPGDKRPRGLNAAFPREDVVAEVRSILQRHIGLLKGMSDTLVRCLLDDYTAVPCPQLELPNRYRGGLLFGQLVPRFDNRIIPLCPVTYERVYQEELKKTGDRERARAEAAKHAKTPLKECREFYEFRWAMIMANIQVSKNGSAVRFLADKEWRTALQERIRKEGFFTPGLFKSAVREITGNARDNLDQMLMHPDATKALVLDPVKRLVQTNETLSKIWSLLPEPTQRRVAGKWRRGKRLALDGILGDVDEAAKGSVRAALAQESIPARGKKARSATPVPPDQRFGIDLLSGRAPYSRSVMEAAARDVVERGIHPSEEGGTLFRTAALRQAQLEREIEDQTNNHLVRHRLLILERLHRDILAQYAGGDRHAIGRIAVEVNRDLREFSGKTAKEIAKDLGSRLSQFKGVAEKMEKALAGKGLKVTPGLIRKGRIAEDLGWACPYTGKLFDPLDLTYRKVDKDHIVPRSMRPSDSLDSLVITFPEINKWKGQRTALQFIEEEQGKPVPGIPHLSVKTLKQYQADVDALETRKGHADDQRRKKNRKRLLGLRDYVEKEFMPRDLTVTSQLTRLAVQVLQKAYTGATENPVIVSLPGSVTGMTRRNWNLLGCLAGANPLVLDEGGEVKTKTEIRDITHLHHALDACVLALGSHYIPGDGSVWELLVRRKVRDFEKEKLRRALGEMVQFSDGGDFRLADLPVQIKEQVRSRLSERRVVQHIPKEMTGLRVEQNAWRIVKEEDGEVLMRQYVRQADGTRKMKESREKAGKVFGMAPPGGDGKLKRLKAGLVIPDNYGLALDPAPQIIPFHKVWPRLAALAKENGGRRPRVLRNGSLIEVPSGRFAGTWRIFSVKNNASGISVDMGQPDVVRLLNGTQGHKINVRVSSLISSGLNVLATPYTGVAACPTTSST